jgi:hypothetical protein
MIFTTDPSSERRIFLKNPQGLTLQWRGTNALDFHQTRNNVMLTLFGTLGDISKGQRTRGLS